MLPAPAGDCDDCVPSYLRARGAGLAGAASSALPLAATFVLWLLVGSRTLFPLLAGGRQARGRRQQVSRAVFAATVALSALLAELVLCEIVGLLDGRARARALRLVLAALLLALLVVVPALEMRSVAAAVTGMLACPVPPGAVEAAGLLVWLLAFWYLGVAVPGTGMPSDRPGPGTDAFISACLERVAVIGIALMAGLAGFAATSALWQTFGRRSREVSDADVARKQAGLDAADAMLAGKQARLRALAPTPADAAPAGLVTRALSSMRVSGEHAERRALQLELAGLETMRAALAGSLAAMQAQRRQQQLARTAAGMLLRQFDRAFAVYCLYRVLAISLAVLRRGTGARLADSDPVSVLLALLARHWDPSLDRAAWTRQISFVLSGGMLLASFNAALQTFYLLARLLPASLLAAARDNLALLVAQVCAVYVLSATFLLRANLPRDLATGLAHALGSPSLDFGFIAAWFDGCFLATAVLTGVGIWVGRQINGARDWDDDDDLESGDVELGKMN